MSRHSFDPQVAEQVGINAAVIYQNIVFWCEKNAANERNIHDGKAWTYNSMTAFVKLFPYLTYAQIRGALSKLEDADLLEAGNFNSDPRDKTKWYCVKSQLHLSKLTDGSVQNDRPLPDGKPDINKPHTPKGDLLLFSELEEPVPEVDRSIAEKEQIESGFKEFWEEIWPSHFRKTGKADCLKVYTSAVLGKHKKAEQISVEALNNATRAFIASQRDLEYLSGPLPWLRKPGWEPFIGSKQVSKPLTRAQVMLNSLKGT